MKLAVKIIALVWIIWGLAGAIGFLWHPEPTDSTGGRAFGYLEGFLLATWPALVGMSLWNRRPLAWWLGVLLSGFMAVLISVALLLNWRTVPVPRGWHDAMSVFICVFCVYSFVVLVLAPILNWRGERPFMLRRLLLDPLRSGGRRWDNR